MVGRPFGLPGPEVGGSHLVEKKEGVQVVERRRRKRTVDEEAGPLEGGDGRSDVFDGSNLHG
jgi:hypothetical protein